MKVLTNCTVKKLREYAQSYGAPEIISVPYINELDKEIWLLNECGEHTRTLRKNTKLLISFSGKEITLRQLTGKAKKSTLLRSEKRQQYLSDQKVKQDERNVIADNQAQMWVKFLSDNPQSKAKYIEKVNTLSSSKWRNYLRMKAAKHINNGEFNGLEISAPKLCQLLN